MNAEKARDAFPMITFRRK